MAFPVINQKKPCTETSGEYIKRITDRLEAAASEYCIKNTQDSGSMVVSRQTEAALSRRVSYYGAAIDSVRKLAYTVYVKRVDCLKATEIIGQ